MAEKTKVVFADALFSLKKMNNFLFDIVFIDPPYRYYENGFDSFLEKFFDIFIDYKLLKTGSLVFVEFPSSLKIGHLSHLNKFALKKVYKYGFSSLACFVF